MKPTLPASTPRSVRRPVGPRPAALSLLAAALLALLPAPATLAQSAQIGDVRLTVEPLPSGSGTTQHGYLEYRVHVDNRSRNQPQRVELRLPANAYSPGSNRISSLTRRLEVAGLLRELLRITVETDGGGDLHGGLSSGANGATVSGTRPLVSSRDEEYRRRQGGNDTSRRTP